MGKDNEELTKQLKALNQNIDTLIRVTAVNIGKEDIFKGKSSKEEKIEILDRMGLPNEIIAIVIGSTSHSVSQFKSMRKPKSQKQKLEARNLEPTTEEAMKDDEPKSV